MLVRFGNFPVAKDGHSIFYEGANRHKKSIALDVGKEEGKQIVYRLVSEVRRLRDQLPRQGRGEASA